MPSAAGAPADGERAEEQAPASTGPESGPQGTGASTSDASGPEAAPGSRTLRPGVAAAAALRGAARGRARAAGGSAPNTAPVAPLADTDSAQDTGAGEQDVATEATPHTAATSLDPELTVRTPVVKLPTNPIRVPAQRGKDQRRGVRFPGPAPTEGAAENTAGDPSEESAEDDEQASKRVRVVLAERKGVARPVRTVVDIQEGTGVGELLRTNLIGSQLAVALRFAIGAGLSLGLLPLLFAMLPEIGRMEVLGLRLPWLLLGVLVYPFLFLLGLWHTRTAERVEQNFADHVQD
ncbi:hypothetical protein [Pseudonocardia sp. MH-G8]|uniref:hypothetical protein n=1 Tax=Pseudonocardia sp. MH-G8 TaxID=1854588 RepID=UPI001179E37D|nr:hypothetical protein [Pseudonocardia sp. MH-G8]